ncbi:MAG TPA: phytoene/squalene synthase family protein [Allocoleopsis sp.]
MNLHEDALEILQRTSRTFYIPISCLPSELQAAVASAYLCMRAIDEIEDHPDLHRSIKVKLLQTISFCLQAQRADANVLDELSVSLDRQSLSLAEVTIRIGEWAKLAPEAIAPRICDATAAMADRMANWVSCNWEVNTEVDLDRYTFGVAGAVGLLLSDLWAWYDGTQTNRAHAVGFGRGLQAVNILRNRNDDLVRGVNFFPVGWNTETMQRYARRNLVLADTYTQSLPKGPALVFCQIPLALAHATLDILAEGKEKLSRSDVVAVIEEVTSSK